MVLESGREALAHVVEHQDLALVGRIEERRPAVERTAARAPCCSRSRSCPRRRAASTRSSGSNSLSRKRGSRFPKFFSRARSSGRSSFEVGEDPHHVVRRHDEVVVRHARLELLEHRLVGVVQVVVHHDAGAARELVDDLLGEVLRPDVDVELLLAGPGVAAARPSRGPHPAAAPAASSRTARARAALRTVSPRSPGGCCSRWAMRMRTTVTASSSVETALTSGVTPTLSIE